MQSSTILPIAFLISILVSSLLSVPSGQDIERPLLAGLSHFGTSEGPRNLHIGESSSRSAVATHTPILQTAVKPIHLLGRVSAFKGKTSTPKIVGQQNWKSYYLVSFKISSAQGEVHPQIKDLANKVLGLGQGFPSEKHSDEWKFARLLPSMDLAYRVLKTDSLKLSLRERIWVVGVLACLKWSIPEQQRSMTSKSFKHDFPRFGYAGNLALFLLKDKPLATIVDKMWEETLGNESLTKYAFMEEAFQRAILAASVARRMHKHDSSKEFKGILQSFLHLNSPIQNTKATRFIADIVARLPHFKEHNTSTPFGFDEEKVLIEFLFHMHKFHQDSRANFQRLAKTRKLTKDILNHVIKPKFEGRAGGKITTQRIYDDLKTDIDEALENLMPALKESSHQGLLIPLISRLSAIPN